MYKRYLVNDQGLADMTRVMRVEPIQEAAVKRPVLVDLLPGDLPDSLHTVQLLQNNNPRKSKQLQLHGENERISVDAVNFGPSSVASAYQYALLVVDDNNPNSPVSIVGPCERLVHKRTVKALEKVVNKTKEPEPEQLDYKTAQNALGEAFGTKKRRQAIHSVEKNQIDMERLQATSAAFINKAIDETIVSRLPTPAPSETGSLAGECVDNGLLPPFCITAEKVADCYPVLGKLVPESIWRALPQFPDQSAFSYSLAPGPLVQSVLGTINYSDPNDQRQFIAAYLTFLLKLFPLKEAAFNDPRNTQPILFGLDEGTQAAILDAFSETVTTESGRKRYKLPAIKKDRLALHICCLALHLFNFTITLNDLADELSLSVTKMQQYFKALGCVVETAGKRALDGRNTHIRLARLACPLVFPKAPMKR